MELSWHFFATSHGKGVVDGVGGVIKRLVYSSILGGQQCTSAADFVAIAQSKTNAIDINEIEQHHIDNSKGQLEQLFQTTKSVPETKQLHSIKVLKNDSIECKYYSNCTSKKIFQF